MVVDPWGEILACRDEGPGVVSVYVTGRHLDRMAAEGIRFTDFYSAGEVCTPSRSAKSAEKLVTAAASRRARVSSPRAAPTGDVPDGKPSEVPVLVDIACSHVLVRGRAPCQASRPPSEPRSLLRD